MKDQEVAQICKALSDQHRLAIIKQLNSGERCACELLEVLEITQPTLSHHMKVLCGCGLVTVRKEGRWAHYRLACEAFQAFKAYIAALECCKPTDAEVTTDAAACVCRTVK